MKTLVLSALIIGTVFFSSCGESKRAVEFSELPSVLQTLITEHFGNETMVYAITERDNGRRKYEVVLSEGTEIDADAKGQWYEIKCLHKNVPEEVVPTQIQGYLSAKHSQAGIRKIENKKKGYEVELANGLEIKFDNNFVVREYDN